MEELQALFGDGSLSYNEFEQKLTEAGETIKLANLKSGNYVDKAKFEKLEKGLEDYKTKYSALEESTKGYTELQTKFDDVSKKYEELLGKQEIAEKMGKIKSANVEDRFAKFVYSEVNALIDDKTDFQTALTKYLKENAQFVNGGKSTYVDLQNGLGGQKSDNAKINEQIRNFRR